MKNQGLVGLESHYGEYDVTGYSHAEIAEDMSIAEITVERRIARAHSDVMKHLEKH
jgi:DNA-directed RNA polymerase specialized sigma24 family protein